MAEVVESIDRSEQICGDMLVAYARFSAGWRILIVIVYSSQLMGQGLVVLPRASLAFGP